MIIGILTAMQVEIESILDKFDLEKIEKHAGSDFNIYKYNNLTIIQAITSIGKVNAAIKTQVMIDKFDVDIIINTGIAGSLNEKVKINNVVLAKNLAYHDFSEKTLEAYFPNCSQFETSEKYLEILAKVASNLDISHHIGTVVSGDKFISNSNLKKEISEKFGALCVEMESAAIAHTAHVNKVPFLIIRAISDNADDDAHETYDNNEKNAADNAALLTLEFLNEISK